MKFLSPFRNKYDNKEAIQRTIKTNPKKNSSYLHLSRNGIIKNVSPEFCALTGHSIPSLKGGNIKLIIDKKGYPDFEDAFRQLSAETPFAQAKIKLIASDNRFINTEVFLTLTSLKEGAPIFAIFRKSGTHQNKYDNLFEKNEKLRILAENTNHVQLLLDTDLKCQYLSRSCYALTGYKYQELLTTDLYTLIHHNDFNLVWETLNYPNTEAENTIVFRIKHKKGNYKWVEARIKKIFDEFSSIIHYAMYIHDATRHIKFENQLQKAKEEAESANKLKSEFLSSISHEFRTPLNAIIGFSRIIAESATDKIFKSYTNCIEKNGNQLLSLVNDLLSYSKLEKDDITISLKKIEIKGFFDNLYEKVKKDASLEQKQHIEIITDSVLYKGDSYFNSDIEILNQIFHNLINNAIKFTNDGYIKFGCKPYGINNYVFFVEDSGIGISSKFQNKIFELLTQKDGSLTRQYGGVGIGLSISKKLIDLLNGEIWLQSEEGAGSAFYFTIPPQILRKV